jgi:hypothetical protein
MFFLFKRFLLLFFVVPNFTNAQPEYFQYKYISLVKQFLPASEDPIDVVLYSGYAITISHTEIQIYDYRDINNPAFVRTHDYSSEAFWRPNCKIVDNYLMIVGNNKIKILDISDFENIVEANTVEIPMNSDSGYEVIKFSEGRIFYSLNSQLAVYDIPDPAQPILVSQFTSATRINGIMIKDSNIIYLSTMEGIDIVDVSNLQNPEIISSYDEDNIYIRGVYFENHLAVTLYYDASIRILDIEDYSNPSEIGYFNGVGDFPSYMIVHGNYLLASADIHPSSLGIYDLTDLSTHNRSARFYNGSKGRGYGIAAEDKLIFYCGLTNGEAPPNNTNGGLFILKNDLITAVENTDELINEYFLSQNYPNPFNPSTIIRYKIPSLSSEEVNGQKSKVKRVTLIVYDLLGRKVTTLVNENQSPGEYQVEFNASANGMNLPSGVYFYRLKSDSFVETRKMILLR